MAAEPGRKRLVSRGRQALGGQERILSPTFEWVLSLPLEGFRLELPTLTGVVFTPAQPHRRNSGSWWSPSQGFLEIIPLL